jgi:putative transposase
LNCKQNIKAILPITQLTVALQGLMTTANIHLLADIIHCFYCVRYGTTTRSLSRYSAYRLRTLFRFLAKDHEWVAIRLCLLKAFVFKQEQHYIAAMDEVVEGKSGKLTHGLSRFYSSVAQKPVVGGCFFGLSLIEVNQRCSYFLSVKQVVYSQEDKKRITQQKANRKQAKARPASGQALAKGRKKGSKNKAGQTNQTASFRTFKALWQESRSLLKHYLPAIKLTHLVADTAYGTLDYLQLASAHQLHIISRMCSNAALYQPYAGAYGGIGRKKRYGPKWNLFTLEEKYLKQSNLQEGYNYKFYELEAFSKSIKGIKLKVVVLKTTRLQDQKESINVFFSDDLSLDYLTMIDYYSLPFQIEFDFRDAKQHFGLSDFKNYTESNLTCFVNLSFLLCLVSKILLGQYKQSLHRQQMGILDLKILFNARNTAKKIFKLTHNQPNIIFNEDFCDQFIPDDLINAA